MELRHLRYFVAVAEELSFTKAARRLHIAQPPLSQQIKDLEQELGFALFSRTHKKVGLTLDGRHFLDDAKAVLEKVDDLQQRARQRAQGLLGNLRVGVYPSYTSSRFAAMIQSFLQNHPGWRITIRDRPSEWQIEALKQRKLDVALVTSAAHITDELAQLPLKSQPMRLAVPSTHALAARKKVAWAELAHESFIMIDPEVVSPSYYEVFLQRCLAAGFDPKASHYSQNSALQLWLVSAGLGIAPIAITTEGEVRPGVVFVALPDDAPKYQISLLWRRDEDSTIINTFTRFVALTLA